MNDEIKNLVRLIFLSGKIEIFVEVKRGGKGVPKR